MLFPIVSYTPKNQNDHASILQSGRYSFALTRSASQAQMKEVVKARTKRRHLGKAPVPPFSLLVNLDSESEDIFASNPSRVSSQSKKISKNMKKFLEMEKEKYFRTKSILRSRTFHPDILSIDVVKRVCELLNFQGWGDLFPDTELLVHKKEVVKFYMNLKVLEENVVTSNVKGVELVFDHSRLGEILHVPTTGLDEYDWPNDEQCLLTSKYSKEGLPPRLRKY
ncbi:hypothetical protein KY289_001476 [Solanum tuberosum]|nr:hypothetical protein KY289_001476 [Solanum tuberosum]